MKIAVDGWSQLYRTLYLNTHIRIMLFSQDDAKLKELNMHC